MKFEDAVKYVLQWEGEFSDDPDDRGGATKWGISSRSHPNVDIKNLTREQAIEIYKKEYWEPNQDIFNTIKDFAKINEYWIITRIFDAIVNVGRKQTILILQRAINSVELYLLNEDGIFGNSTRESLISVVKDEIESHKFYSSFKSERAAYYRVLAAKNPSQEKFLVGWLRRSYS